MTVTRHIHCAYARPLQMCDSVVRLDRIVVEIPEISVSSLRKYNAIFKPIDCFIIKDLVRQKRAWYNVGAECST